MREARRAVWPVLPSPAVLTAVGSPTATATTTQDHAGSPVHLPNRGQEAE